MKDHLVLIYVRERILDARVTTARGAKMAKNYQAKNYGSLATVKIFKMADILSCSEVRIEAKQYPDPFINWKDARLMSMLASKLVN